MAEIQNRPNPLNQYSVITTKEFTATTSISGSTLKAGPLTTTAGTITGATTITGSGLVLMGSTGSILLGTYGTATGSKIASLYLVCTVTGSTYHLALYSPT